MTPQKAMEAFEASWAAARVSDTDHWGTRLVEAAEAAYTALQALDDQPAELNPIREELLRFIRAVSRAMDTWPELDADAIVMPAVMVTSAMRAARREMLH